MTTLDPSKFKVVRDVPIVDTFELSRGDHDYQIDDQFLIDLVAHSNKREKETGDCPVLLLGHHKDGEKEEEQPRVVGFAKNLRIRPLGKTGRNAAVGDLWVYKEDADVIKRFPRRSAEIWYGRRELDAVALLGATAPQRDLGLITLASRTPDIKLSRELNTVPAENETPDAGMPKWASELIAKLDSILAAVAPQPKPDAKPEVPAGPDAAGAPGPEDQVSDEDIEAFLRELEQGGAQGQEIPKGADEKVNADYSFGGGMNTSQPKELTKLQRDVARLEAELAERDVKEKLVQLQRDGYKLDIPAETKTLMSVDPESRKILLARIETNYTKAPVGDKRLPGLDDAEGTPAPKVSQFTDEKRKEVVKLQRESGGKKKYEECFFEVMKFPISELAKGN